ncbi:MAG: FAD-dependent oxidoreductase [Myxococcota bacterium]|nr:FAD-dependent oxidoreductase [Myxococcota bacterium]
MPVAQARGFRLRLRGSCSFILILAALFFLPVLGGASPSIQYDVVIYGATPSGLAAAVEAERLGKEAVVVEPTSRIGGMTTNGLSLTDFGNKSAVKGLARQFYEEISLRYGARGPRVADHDLVLNFEPKVALAVFLQWAARYGFTVLTDERLDLDRGVSISDGLIESIRMESGLEIGGKVFIDASYEGDLMATAGVSYIVGREPTLFTERGITDFRGIRSHHTTDSLLFTRLTLIVLKAIRPAGSLLESRVLISRNPEQEMVKSRPTIFG